MFDSGLGGLSVLAALHQRLPQAPLWYIGDTAHAPYGERPAAEVITRCRIIAKHFRQRGAGLIVIACNTATALAIEALRNEWADVTIVGIEPGVKPAVAATRGGRIALMVTPATAASDRLRRLIDRHAPGVHCHVEACAGLAAAIEREPEDGATVQSLLRKHCDAIRAAEVDTVVLGCTHYPLVSRSIGEMLGQEVLLIDTSHAVAEHVARLWSAKELLPIGPAVPEIYGTGDIARMQSVVGRTAQLVDGQVRGLRI